VDEWKLPWDKLSYCWGTSRYIRHPFVEIATSRSRRSVGSAIRSGDAFSEHLNSLTLSTKATAELIRLCFAAIEQRYHKRYSGLHAEFVIDRVQVSFDRTFVQTQFLGDHLIGQSITDQICDLLLTLAQGSKSFCDIWHLCGSMHDRCTEFGLPPRS
jgi:hypothetical protein